MFTEKGQGIVEFAIVLAVVVIFMLVVIALVGPQIGNIYSGTLENL